MEDDHSFIDYGVMVVKGEKKNAQIRMKVEKLVDRYRPDILVLADVNAKGAHRVHRIKRLHQQIVVLAGKRKLKVVMFSGTQLRAQLLGNPKGTKYEMAEMLAKQFPDELASRLPPKRKPWTSEDARMDIFEAVGLALLTEI
jgi:Holliday junction resolvasome RuvABC endonuclease subunit